MTNRLYTQQKLSMRKLAKQFASHLETAKAKRILITSVNRGDGKRLFVTELSFEWSKLGERPFLRIEAANLTSVKPELFADEIIIVEGPAFFDKDGLLALPENWLRAFDTALILVMARATKQRDLKQLVEWLNEYKVANIWAVWNELKAPRAEMIWPSIKRQLDIGEQELLKFKRKKGKGFLRIWDSGPESGGPKFGQETGDAPPNGPPQRPSQVRANKPVSVSPPVIIADNPENKQ